jgi:hypothetical protein
MAQVALPLRYVTDQTGRVEDVLEGPGQVCEGVDPMGRGRAKAKQTKVARDLKYRTHETDFGALAKELHGEENSHPRTTEVEPDEDEWSYGDPRRRAD